MLVTVALVVGGTVWFVRHQSQATESEKLQRALGLLSDREDLDARQAARKLAVELHRSGFRDPSFSGGTEYVLGIVAFRRAQDAKADERERFYLRAAQKLRECEQQALSAEYRPEWSYALGVSLHELGNSPEALPLLQEAERSFPAGKADAALRLIDVLRDRKQPGELRSALKLAEGLLKSGRLTVAQRD
ncbi:MAG: tol-pal system YbgF family protein, partial [Planctomycetaceae bacterium]